MRHALTRSLTGLLLSLCLSVPIAVMSSAPAQAADTVPCDKNGTTSADAAIATQLNRQLTGRMRDSMTAYRVSCARVIIATVKSRGLPIRAAQIAITTTIVETTIRNLTYGADDSVGLFQQRPSQGWGTVEQILNPVYATNKFLSKMLQFDWRDDPIGQICQQVQVSAFPEKYAEEAGDGVAIANAVWSMSEPAELPSNSVTGDSFTDLLAVDAGGTMRLYSNNFARDDGRPWASAPREVGHGWGGSTRIIPADVTGDGFTDLLAVDAGGTMRLYSNNFARDDGQPWGSAPREVGHGWSSTTRIIPADVTGDGFTDLLAVDAAGTMRLYSNNFARDDGQPWGSAPREVGHGWSGTTRIIPADVTGDGFTDLLAVDAGGTMRLYSNNFMRDDGQPWGSAPREVGHGWSSTTRIIPADVTGDGFTDLLAVDAGGTMRLYSNNFVRDDGQPWGSAPREVGHGWSGSVRILA
ncbi:FG-GAP-like repeat-containing protein [Nonomuraea sp. SBT364]|uniref:FG-GAP-like repeat-containing protein n=1 Tax=Nonomuraea sp. SBT364 TaxID=1580530 RepID=UPI00069CD30B|nr:FG-GAP-like repeat-containing protein [Nonomuraea sp. SBT364]